MIAGLSVPALQSSGCWIYEIVDSSMTSIAIEGINYPKAGNLEFSDGGPA